MLDFAETLVSPPAERCLGVRMLPYSLGHELHLTAIGSAFLRDGIPAYEDLIAAASICSNTWEENARFLRSPGRQWLKLKVWGMLAGKFDVAAEMAAMMRHVRLSREIPETKQERGRLYRHLYSDWNTRLYVFLTERFTESQALNMPLLAANLMFVAHLESAGSCTFVSKHEMAIYDRMAELADSMPDSPEQSLPA